MFSQDARLTKKLFDAVFNNGKTVSGDTLYIVYTHEKNQEKARCAVVVPKKVVKTAVERNQLRRRGYEALREIYPELDPTLQLILFYKKGASHKKYEEIAEEIKSVCEKARLLTS